MLCWACKLFPAGMLACTDWHALMTPGLVDAGAACCTSAHDATAHLTRPQLEPYVAGPGFSLGVSFM
jgi:hypothetical protein